MNKKILLTIGRQYGSGGHEIGERLAKELNIKLWDKDILLKSSENSGLSKELLEQFDEKPTNSFLYSLVMGLHAGQNQGGKYNMPLPEKIFLSQFETIKKIANEGSGIFIGRCADYALKDYDNRISIFIYAPMESRIKRIGEHQNVSPKEAADIIKRNDRQRALYYNYYSLQQWGEKNNYHLCIDSSLCGIDGTAQVIYNIIENNAVIIK